MRKRIIDHRPRDVRAGEYDWLDLERLAQVEITSEDIGYSVESALRLCASSITSAHRGPRVRSKTTTSISPVSRRSN